MLIVIILLSIFLCVWLVNLWHLCSDRLSFNDPSNADLSIEPFSLDFRTIQVKTVLRQIRKVGQKEFPGTISQEALLVLARAIWEGMR